ncbi:MAG: hypothetical protein QGH24_04560 [Candidatus Marinimicrobia bacterium]|jgi:hypothetical protein|nr:hypothetical protein [Candidatus Neomarinimicrobiota bacterium]|tara:strand:+ start:100 stop:501 length:402 start_codon:yes stop_codon:yes gene_type:complete
MRNQREEPFRHFVVIFFTLAILSQSAIESPVLCFESDGHMNVEVECSTECEYPPQKNDGHQDTCFDCIDIQFWNYNPEFTFLIQQFNFDNPELDIQQIFLPNGLNIESITEYKLYENPISLIPPLLKSAILII